MEIVCPVCRARASIEAWLDDPQKMKFARQFRKIPAGLGELTLWYIGLFRPRKRSLAWRRAANLVHEMSQLYSTGHIQIKHEPARPCPAEIWKKGLMKILDRPPRSLPLTNHNYLKKIVYEIADDADMRAEYEKNQAERNGTLRRITKEMLKPFGGMSHEEMRMIKEKNYKRRHKK